jgi:hypothetical protein
MHLLELAMRRAPPAGLVVALVESKNGRPAARVREELNRINKELCALGRACIATGARSYPRNPGCIVGFLRFEGTHAGGTLTSPWATQNPAEFALRVTPGSATLLPDAIPCEGAQTPLTRFGPKREEAEIAFRAAWASLQM